MVSAPGSNLPGFKAQGWLPYSFCTFKKKLILHYNIMATTQPKYLDYCVVWGKNSTEIEKSVKERMSMGWECLGGISYGQPAGTSAFFQAMVKAPYRGGGNMKTRRNRK